MHTETMAQAVEEMQKILNSFYEGCYTLQETGDAIYLLWSNCKERQDLANAS